MEIRVGQSLKCKNGELVIVKVVTDSMIYVEYKGAVYQRSKDIIGIDLFILPSDALSNDTQTASMESNTASTIVRSKPQSQVNHPITTSRQRIAERNKLHLKENQSRITAKPAVTTPTKAEAINKPPIKHEAPYGTVAKFNTELGLNHHENAPPAAHHKNYNRFECSDYDDEPESQVNRGYGSAISIGDTVEFKYVDTNEVCEFKIIDVTVKYTPKRMGGAYYGTSYRTEFDSKAKPDQGTISCNSPLGKALLGKKNGQTVYYETPGGREIVEIIGVR